MNHCLSAVIVAAGRGLRFKKSQGDIESPSKALVPLEGVPLFVRTLQALSRLPISEWILVVHPDEEALFQDALKKLSTPLQKLKIVYGGNRRQDSVRNGLEAAQFSDRVFIHDAARPNLSPAFLDRLYEKALQYDAVIPVLPIVETVKEINANGEITKTLDRNFLVRVQTPQFFRYDLIMKAHQEFRDTRLEFTDDAAMLEALKIPVQTCEGSIQNIKVTTVDDLVSTYVA